MTEFVYTFLYPFLAAAAVMLLLSVAGALEDIKHANQNLVREAHYVRRALQRLIEMCEGNEP